LVFLRQIRGYFVKVIIILNIFGFDLSDIFDPILKKLRRINQDLLKICSK